MPAIWFMSCPRFKCRLNSLKPVSLLLANFVSPTRQSWNKFLQNLPINLSNVIRPGRSAAFAWNLLQSETNAARVRLDVCSRSIGFAHFAQKMESINL